MNICGCLLHALPDKAAQVRTALDAVPGVEVHAEAAGGRLVVVIEDTPERLASETIMAVHQIPGVLSLTLSYHYFGDPSQDGLAPLVPNPSTAGDQAHDNV